MAGLKVNQTDSMMDASLNAERHPFSFGKLREIAHMGEEDWIIQNMKKGLLS